MGSFEDVALVVRRFRYGETSLVVQLLTRRHGKVGVLAKGAYRPTSGYCGVLDYFDTLQVGWRTAPRAELGTLVSASIGTRRKTLSLDLDRYRCALSALELAGLVARDGDADPALFDLTAEALDELARARAAPELVLVAFDLRFLRAVGLEPALERCAACGGALAAGASVPFSASSGGALCGRCARAAADAGRRVASLPLHTLRIARSLMDAPAAALSRIRLEPGPFLGVRDFVQGFLEYHLETRPRTRRAERGTALRRSRRRSPSAP